MSKEAAAKSHRDGAKKAVIAALFANLAVAAGKFVAASVSHSSAMMAEAFHSLADTINQVFLLLGMKLGARPADEEHPFGYGRERFFWAFIVALSIFSLGALLSIIEGVKKIQVPHTIHNPLVSYVVLAVAAIFESIALRVAYKEFKEWRELNPGPFFEGLKSSKSPTILVVLFEDSAALLGLLVAAVGITLTLVTGNGIWDGLASLAIGVILLGAAYFLGWRTRGLLLGEAATKADRERIRNAVETVPQVARLIEQLTLQLGPNEILVNLHVNFTGELATDELESAIDQIEERIRAAVPAATRIFIEAESLRTIRTA
jgi:cation diffusion facilitator family transporter